MKVYRSLEALPKIKNAIVTQGTFDGVHIAHQVIINRLKQIAQIKEGENVVITFEPHPRMVLFPDDHGLKLLHTLDEKIEALRSISVQHLVVLPFDKAFSRLTSVQFIRDIIVNKLGTKVLVIGYNHRFGKNREGTFEHLKEFSSLYGFDVEEIPEQDINEVSVSSTLIRKALDAGEIKRANAFLGYHFFIHGTVVEGKKIGRTIGFPTANILPNHVFKQIPAQGVYAVKVFINNKMYGGMLNIGNRPTVNGVANTIEVNVFEFNEDIYHQTIKIAFVDKLRDEIKFSGLEALTFQLQKDKLQALAILSS